MRIRFSPAGAVAAVALTALSLPLAGCGLTDTHPWKSTRSFYYSHVNTPAKLDLDETTKMSDADRRLAERLMTVDAQLTSLEHALDALSGPVDQNVPTQLMRQFPWLSGVMMISPEGQLLASMPSTPMKNLDFQALLEPDPIIKMRDLRAAAQDTPLGPEVMLAKPFLNGAELKFLLVATFDFRSLMPYASTPDDLTVRTADVVLWTGNGASPLEGVNWEEVLRKHSRGTVNEGAGKAVWLARYLAATPLVFATPAAN